jgi:hypothetical protein
MKIYLHIVNNRPFRYGWGPNHTHEADLPAFIRAAEQVTGTTFSQSPDRCEDNIDFYAADGKSLIHIITLDDNSVYEDLDIPSKKK